METPQTQDQPELVNDLRKNFLDFPIGNYLRSIINGAPIERRPQLTIQLFGKAGHGKSELINSCLCVARDEPYKNISGATESLQAVSRKRALYSLTRNIRICDNRGLLQIDKLELYEMGEQLKGKRGDISKDVDFQTSFLAWWIGLNTVNENAGNLYVPVIVYKCESDGAEDLVPGLEPLIKMITNISGRSPVIVLICSKGNNPTPFKQAFNDCGCHDVLAVENYTERNPERTHDKDAAILTFLLRCLEFVQNEARRQRKI